MGQLDELLEREEKEKDEEQEDQLEVEDGAEKKEPVSQSSFDGPNIHEALRGKTPEEISTIFSTLSSYSQGLAARVQEHLNRPDPPVEAPKFEADDFLGGGDSFQEKLDAHWAAKSQPYIQGMQRIQIQQAAMQAKQAYPLLDRYGAETNAILANATPEQLANPATYAQVNAYLIQTHTDDLLDDREAARKRKPLAPVTTKGSAAVESKGVLSQEEKLVARMLGVSNEDYLKNRDG